MSNLKFIVFVFLSLTVNAQQLYFPGQDWEERKYIHMVIMLYSFCRYFHTNLFSKLGNENSVIIWRHSCLEQKNWSDYVIFWHWAMCWESKSQAWQTEPIRCNWQWKRESEWTRKRSNRQLCWTENKIALAGPTHNN